MTVTVKINTDTSAGQQLADELRRYPDTVEFIHSTVVSELKPEGYNLLNKAIHTAGNTALINADTPTGKTLIHKLESQRQLVEIIYPYPTDSNGNEIESLSATESARQAFSRLGEKYDHVFVNKYTV